MTRRLIPLALILSACLLAACGEKEEPAAAGGGSEPLKVMLDYFPNADHAGLYAAQASGAYERAGLDVEITPPPDPSSPLKLMLALRNDVTSAWHVK